MSTSEHSETLPPRPWSPARSQERDQDSKSSMRQRRLDSSHSKTSFVYESMQPQQDSYLASLASPSRPSSPSSPSTSSLPSLSLSGLSAQQYPQLQQGQELQQGPQSVLSALPISMYQSLSFSRSPSFERTRYIASTCTFIAILYLRTLHCLYFGTGALSCAILAKCLKHTIRQPRPDILAAEESCAVASSAAHLNPTSSPSTTRAVATSIAAGASTGSTDSSLASLTSSSATSTSCLQASTSSQTTAQTLFSNSAGSDVEEKKDQVSSGVGLGGGMKHTVIREQALQNENSNGNNSNHPPATDRPEQEQEQQSQRQYQQQQLQHQQQPQHYQVPGLYVRQGQRRRKFVFRVDYGMPSSHAQLVSFFVCYISLQLILMEPEGSFGQWFLILLLQLYAWSVVWSRVRLGRHSISQVMVGAGIGALYGMMWFGIWCWKIEEMVQHWQWLDRYGVVNVRKLWRQLEMDGGFGNGGMLDENGMPIQYQYQYMRL